MILTDNSSGDDVIMEMNVKIIEAARKIVQSHKLTDELVPIKEYDGFYISRGVISGMQPMHFIVEHGVEYAIGTKAA